MSNRYKKKKRLKKRNLLISILTVLILGSGCNKLAKNIFNKEEDVLAINTSKINSDTVKDGAEDTQEENVAKKTSFKVVIDACYGGSDGGSRGYNGIIQKNINLDIALKIKKVLERHEDIEVILTRDKDKTISLDERLDIINNSGADLLVSIMQNNEGSGEAFGVESYVLPRENEKSNTTFGYTLQQAMTMYVDTKDRGVLAKNMDILLKSNVPGAIVNTGFISNKKEGTNLSSNKYQLRMAEGISQGILSYIDRYLKE